MKVFNFNKMGYFSILIIIGLFLQGFMSKIKTEFYTKRGNQLYNSKDYKGAFENYKNASELNDGYAYYQLYYLYNSGKGVKKDKKLASKMLEKAVSLGYTDAEVLLGSKIMFTKDINRAIELFKKAAKKNNKSAYRHLTLIYFYGIGVKENIKEAKKYIKQAKTTGINIPLPKKRKIKLKREKQITKIQIGLKKLGFYKGKIDGKNNPTLKKAARSFLSKQKYKKKGISFANLLKKINEDIKN